MSCIRCPPYPPPPSGTATETDIASVVAALSEASKVVIVPGYGLAVANAQHVVAEVAKLLTDKGISVCMCVRGGLQGGGGERRVVVGHTA